MCNLIYLVSLPPANEVVGRYFFQSCLFVCPLGGGGGPMWSLPMMHWILLYKDMSRPQCPWPSDMGPTLVQTRRNNSSIVLCVYITKIPRIICFKPTRSYKINDAWIWVNIKIVLVVGLLHFGLLHKWLKFEYQIILLIASHRGKAQILQQLR